MIEHTEMASNVSLEDSSRSTRMRYANSLETESEDMTPATVASKLFEYCRERNWAGWDPYDGLNSWLFQVLPLQYRIPRLALTQLLKRSPVNFRSLLLVPRGQNPKGVALFLSATVKLHRLRIVESESVVQDLANILLRLASLTGKYMAWGYHFPWQTRTRLIPRGMPNIICTTFAANALLDLHELVPDHRLVKGAVRAARFIVDRLYRKVNERESCFSYTPLETTEIHNANLLGAALVARVARITGELRMREVALRAARYTVNRQHQSGSWAYGEREHPSQRWIDHFHTGFNLCALRETGFYAGTTEFEPSIKRGFHFYRQQLFTGNGVPKYYSHKLYPIDIHSISQSLISLSTFQDLDGSNIELATNVYKWAVSNMWDERGYFYYQKYSWGTIKIPYMRWAQAWMLLGLASLETLYKSRHMK